MLVLALVARGSDVLAEAHEPGYERFVSAATTILAKVHESGTPRVSYAFEQWLFHCMHGDDLSYLAVAEADAGRRVPFAFLEAMKQARVQNVDEIESLRRAWNARGRDPIQQAQSELGHVKDVLTQNVEHILSRGEQLDFLVDRTDSAAHQSLAFRRRAVSLRREMWWRNTRIVALMSVCALVRICYLCRHCLFLCIMRCFHRQRWLFGGRCFGLRGRGAGEGVELELGELFGEVVVGDAGQGVRDRVLIVHGLGERVHGAVDLVGLERWVSEEGAQRLFRHGVGLHELGVTDGLVHVEEQRVHLFQGEYAFVDHAFELFLRAQVRERDSLALFGLEGATDRGLGTLHARLPCLDLSLELCMHGLDG